MRPAEFYRGREQSYLKHFVLEKYLERLAYNVFSFADEIVYVDGFAGPWRNEHEDYEDTSFYIASQKLHEIAKSRGKKARAIFIEENSERFAQLKKAAQSAPIPADVLNGSFENLIPQLARMTAGGRSTKSFTFYFVDPTGWTGLSLEKLRPLIANRSAEVLINFMYDHVNRFVELESVRASVEDFFGGPIVGIKDKTGAEREQSILNLYTKRLQACASDVLTTSTRIRKPLGKRAYFHLVYATHHVKGLVEFKTVVEKLAPEELEAWAKMRDAQDAIKGQQSLFLHAASPQPSTKDPRSNVVKADIAQKCDRLLTDNVATFERYEDTQRLLLQDPDVWNVDVEAAARRAIQSGLIAVPELAGRKKKLLPKYKIVRP